MSCYTEFLQDMLLGIKFSVPHKEGVRLTNEGFEIYPMLHTQEKSDKEITACISFTVLHNSLLTTPMHDRVKASGETIEQALGNGVRLWVEGTLPVLHYLHHGPKELSKVTKIELTSKVDDMEPHRFELICGPLQNDFREVKKKSDLDEETPILEAIQDPLSTHPFDDSIVSIVAQVSKKGKDIQTICTLNDKEWDAGSEALTYWAEKWGPCNPPKVKKQVFLCIPIKK